MAPIAKVLEVSVKAVIVDHAQAGRLAIAEVEDPTPESSQTLVRVHAFSRHYVSNGTI